MKTRKIFYSLAVLLTAIFTQSCLKNNGHEPDNKYYPNGIVTVKTSPDNTIFLQLDDQTTLLPVNIKKHPFEGKEVRALLNFEEVQEKHEGYTKAVKVNWIDSILTKQTIPYVIADEKKYGNDQLEILNDPKKAIEDGYLNLKIRTVWSQSTKRHMLNLVSGKNPDEPYELELRHNAFGDIYGRPADAYVAFNLKSLPDTKGETVKIKLVWRSFYGEKHTLIDYKTKEK
ncbi:NigD-like protein [Porphyromonadaceae bacterium W3.11]|nr:NigD-like protein [Porphyromonadaceae bacterium W3.11]